MFSFGLFQRHGHCGLFGGAGFAVKCPLGVRRDGRFYDQLAVVRHGRGHGVGVDVVRQVKFTTELATTCAPCAGLLVFGVDV